VFVIEDGKARQQQVTLGARQGKLVEIVEGLKGSEILAISNVNQLATGTSVGNADAEGNEGRGGRRGGRQGGRGRGEGAAQ